jgi:hypothetical protein
MISSLISDLRHIPLGELSDRARDPGGDVADMMARKKADEADAERVQVMAFNSVV